MKGGGNALGALLEAQEGVEMRQFTSCRSIWHSCRPLPLYRFKMEPDMAGRGHVGCSIRGRGQAEGAVLLIPWTRAAPWLGPPLGSNEAGTYTFKKKKRSDGSS